MESPPFESARQLSDELDTIGSQGAPQLKSQPQQTHLPGYPRVTLDDTANLCKFIHQEFNLADLEKMAPRLWLMSMQSSKNISPLHRQKVKGRDIIITEDPRMHLIWYYDRIFLKPLPKYLLSYRFWTKYLLATTSPLGDKRESIRRVALGYLRTYFYLIRYESDFRIATDDKLQLVPKNISWGEFCDFSSSFDRIQDHEVALRYAFGEIRLSRLNFYTKLFLRGSNFQRLEGQYGTYFARFYGPIFFTFGIFSVLLNAMQVGLAVDQLRAKDQWVSFWLACRWFSIICLVVVVGLSLWLASLFAFKFVREWRQALGDRWKKRASSTRPASTRP